MRWQNILVIFPAQVLCNDRQFKVWDYDASQTWQVE